MKRLAFSLFVIASALWAFPTVRRSSLASLEGTFTRTLQAANMEILALPRGVYLEGYGAVFTADVNLTFTPTPSPFRLTIDKPEIDRIYQKKLAQLPILRSGMQQILLEAGSTLEAVPVTEQIVLVVTLGNEKWEITGALPSQIYMQAQRKRLIEAKQGKVAVETIVKVQQL